MSTASNDTKLVRRGDNPHKKTLMYMLYISCNYRLSGMFTCKKKKEPEVRMWPSDRLDLPTLRKGRIRNKVTIRTSEWGDPNIGVRPPSGRNPSNRVGFPITSEWGFTPSLEMWTWYEPKVGVQLINRLNVTTLSKGRTRRGVTIRFRSHPYAGWSLCFPPGRGKLPRV